MVICTHPIDQVTPATIDFSKLTKEKAGRIDLTVRSHPSARRGGRIKVEVAGNAVSLTEIGPDEPWRHIPIAFDHEDVVVTHHPLDWACEGMFIDYDLAFKPDSALHAAVQKANPPSSKVKNSGAKVMPKAEKSASKMREQVSAGQKNAMGPAGALSR